MDKKLKLLIFCEPKSVHSVRWINQLRDTGWKVKVASPVAPNWNFWTTNHISPQNNAISAEIAPVELVQSKIGVLFQLCAFFGKVIMFFCKKTKIKNPNLDGFYNRLISNYWRSELSKLINDFQPDIVHSLAINQDWRNLCLPVLELKQNGKIKSPWIYSSWGTDLTFYPDLDVKFKREVERIIRSVDYYISECKRDYDQAVLFGLQGKYLGSLPAFGGIHTTEMKVYRSQGKVSERRKIYIKGRGEEDPVGMAMEIMNALEANHDLLKGYEILIGQATPSIINKSVDLKEHFGLNIKILPFMKNPDDILKFVGNSRVFASYTKNDGLPASLTESMVLGAFPIFSKLLSIEEWITSGENGFLVDVEDPKELAAYLKQALLDDALVDKAAEINLNIIEQKMDYQKIKSQVISIYQKVAEENGNPVGMVS